jgi:hypothetical protein
MTEISGMVELLRSIASKLENGAEGLRKDFLLEVADKLERLEIAARVAGTLVSNVPRSGDGALRSLVPRLQVVELVSALNAAGHYGPNGGLIEHRRS